MELVNGFFIIPYITYVYIIYIYEMENKIDVWNHQPVKDLKDLKECRNAAVSEARLWLAWIRKLQCSPISLHFFAWCRTWFRFSYSTSLPKFWNELEKNIEKPSQFFWNSFIILYHLSSGAAPPPGLYMPPSLFAAYESWTCAIWSIWSKQREQHRIHHWSNPSSAHTNKVQEKMGETGKQRRTILEFEIPKSKEIETCQSLSESVRGSTSIHLFEFRTCVRAIPGGELQPLHLFQSAKQNDKTKRKRQQCTSNAPAYHAWESRYLVSGILYDWFYLHTSKSSNIHKYTRYD